MYETEFGFEIRQKYSCRGGGEGPEIAVILAAMAEKEEGLRSVGALFFALAIISCHLKSWPLIHAMQILIQRLLT